MLKAEEIKTIVFLPILQLRKEASLEACRPGWNPNSIWIQSWPLQAKTLKVTFLLTVARISKLCPIMTIWYCSVTLMKKTTPLFNKVFLLSEKNHLYLTNLFLWKKHLYLTIFFLSSGKKPPLFNEFFPLKNHTFI